MWKRFQSIPFADTPHNLHNCTLLGWPHEISNQMFFTVLENRRSKALSLSNLIVIERLSSLKQLINPYLPPPLTDCHLTSPRGCECVDNVCGKFMFDRRALAGVLYSQRTGGGANREEKHQRPPTETLRRAPPTRKTLKPKEVSS